MLEKNIFFNHVNQGHGNAF